ncbi:MAG: hypothetical protein HY400_04465 [Elusimicrobia bacterium]|nr:hypothetical protein [Elusimicrobiota bacterium]
MRKVGLLLGVLYFPSLLSAQPILSHTSKVQRITQPSPVFSLIGLQNSISGFSKILLPHINSGDSGFVHQFLKMASQVRWNKTDGPKLAHHIASARILKWILDTQGIQTLQQVLEKKLDPTADKKQEAISSLQALALQLERKPSENELKKFWDNTEILRDAPASIRLPLKYRHARNKMVNITRFLQTENAQEILKQHSDAVLPGYSHDYFKDKPESIAKSVKYWWRIQDEYHRKNPQLLNLKHELAATIRSYAKEPKVFYLGIGYDLITPLLSTDFSELIGVGKYEKDSFPQFQKIMQLHIRNANSRPNILEGKITDVSFKKLARFRYEVRFQFQGRERRAVFYQKYDMLDENQALPFEVAGGYHILYMHGSGLFATLRIAKELLNLLDPQTGFISYNSSYVQITHDTIVQEDFEKFINRLGKFQSIDYGPSSRVILPGKCRGQSCEARPAWTLLQKESFDAGEREISLKNLPHLKMFPMTKTFFWGIKVWDRRTSSSSWGNPARGPCRLVFHARPWHGRRKSSLS